MCRRLNYEKLENNQQVNRQHGRGTPFAWNRPHYFWVQFIFSFELNSIKTESSFRKKKKIKNQLTPFSWIGINQDALSTENIMNKLLFISIVWHYTKGIRGIPVFSHKFYKNTKYTPYHCKIWLRTIKLNNNIFFFKFFVSNH